MKKSLYYSAAVVAILVLIALLYRHLQKSSALWLEGTVSCTTYRASSKLAGRIAEIRVEEGDEVTEGELLYILSTPELDAKMEQALGAENTARALDEKALRGAREEQKSEVKSIWQKAQAGRVLAERSFTRIERLFREGVIPAQQYDEAQANLEAATATEEAARAQYELVLAGATTEDRQAAAGGLQQAQGAVAEVESYLKDALVYAPATGEVSTIAAEPGELVSSGFPVVTILQLRVPRILFNIREELLSKIRIGTPMRAFVPALNRPINLEVFYIAPQADYTTQQATRDRGGFDLRTFQIKCRPIEPVEGLRPGMSVLVNWHTIQ